MTRGILNKLQKKDIAQCVKCLQEFNEYDIIATSTAKRYCYECATLINLVTGKVNKDLNHDKFIPEVLQELESIVQKLKINDDISKLSILLIATAIKNTNYVSKNKTGLACAAIFLACKIKNQFIVDTIFPVSQKTVQKNTMLLQKTLAFMDIGTLSKTIQGVKN